MEFWLKKALFVLFLLAFLPAESALAASRRAQPKGAATRVRITQGHVNPDPVAFVNFHVEPGANGTMAQTFLEIMQKDLCGCGAFRAVPPAAFVQKDLDFEKHPPRLQDWRLIKARFLLYGVALPDARGCKIAMRLCDVNWGHELMRFSVVVNGATLRKAAHMAADQVYTRVTGERGMFDTRIAYVETQPPKGRRGHQITHLRRIKIMDQDGANDMALTGGDNLVMTPRFSPDGKTIAYLAYQTVGSGRNRKPTAHVYLLDVATKRSRALLTSEHFEAIARANGGGVVNMTYAPRFSPDGQSVCFSLIIDGKSAIYTMNIQTGRIRRLTSHVAIDTSPDFSRDGKQIVFTSNRSGKEKIYIMNADGSGVRRVTNKEGKYSQPTFSPRGDFISFSKQVGNQFFIGVVRPNGEEERLITQSYLAEAPSWSPNGRYIVFTRQAGPRVKSKICMVDLTGFFMKEMNTPREASGCSWSPLLP